MSRATLLERINPFLKKANYTISLLLVVILFFGIMTHLNKEVRDLDIWLHLKTGEQIALNKEVPLTDIFSFTKQGQPWINHEWLFQLLTYSFQSQFGLDGLIVMQNIVFLAIFLILLKMGLRNRNFIFVTTILYILLLNSSYRFTIRPDMFSVLFLVLFVFILKEKRKFLNLLPLLQVLWTNFHGFFFMGPLVILIFAITKKDKKLIIIFFLSILATTINPQILKGALYPFSTLFGLFENRIVFDFIHELKKPITLKTIFDFKHWIFYKALIFISLFSFRFNQKKFNLALFITWLTFLVFSLFAIRNIIYFAVIAAMVIFYNTKDRLSYDNNFSNKKFVNNRFYYFGRFSLIFVFSFCMIKNSLLNIDSYYYDFNNYNFKSCLWGESLRNFPKESVDFIVTEKLPARLFNDFNSGSYLIGQTYPSRKVFIDGRTELYGNDFIKLYKDATEGDKNAIRKIINKYQLDGFLLTMAMSNFDEKLARYLYQAPDWKPVYFDESAIIFIKDSPENRDIIEEFHIDLKQWKAPSESLEKIPPTIIFPYKNIKRGKALTEMGCFEAAISEAKVALKILPNCIEAFEILGRCYIELENYSLAMENLRIAVTLAPNSESLRHKFAMTLYKLGYYDEAKIHLNKLIISNPKNPENYFALAKTYKKSGNLKDAEDKIRDACKLNKNKEFDSLKFWAEILFEMERFKESYEKNKLAQQIKPDDAEIRENLKKLEKFL